MTLPRFDYVGSLALASDLAAAEGWVGEAATSRQRSRDAALVETAFAGPYSDDARLRAEAADQVLASLTEFGDTAKAWALAWAAAVDRRNAHYHELAQAEVRRNNARLWSDYRLFTRLFPDEYIPRPETGKAHSPKPAEPPVGKAFAATASFAHYGWSGVDQIPSYTTSD